jgi:hypothetical protein
MVARMAGSVVPEVGRMGTLTPAAATPPSGRGLSGPGAAAETGQGAQRRCRSEFTSRALELGTPLVVSQTSARLLSKETAEVHVHC